jgi:DTW domain-containing protein YfiP
MQLYTRNSLSFVLSRSFSTMSNNSISLHYYLDRSSSDQLFHQFRSSNNDLQGFELGLSEMYIGKNQRSRDLLIRQNPTVSLVPWRVYNSSVNLMQSKLCPHCWLKQAVCICNRLQQFSSKHRIIILMHHTEFTRASNTAKFAVRLDGHKKNKILIQGIPAHDQQLSAIFQQHSEETPVVVLFPDDSAVAAGEFVQRYLSKNTETNAKDDNTIRDSIPSLTVIVLDGTYRQAAALRKNVPANIPYIRITPDGQLHKLFGISTERDDFDYNPSVERKHELTAEQNRSLQGKPLVQHLFSPLRKQQDKNRCSSVEAVAHLLLELKEPVDTAIAPLIGALKYLVDSMRVQSCYHLVYNSYTKEEMNEMHNNLIKERNSANLMGDEGQQSNCVTVESLHPKPCLKYNSGQCKKQSIHHQSSAPNIAADASNSALCNYAHVCWICSSADHIKSHCPHKAAQSS